MDYQQPPVHYEQVYIKHLDGHEGEDEVEEDLSFLTAITLMEYRQELSRMHLVDGS